MQCDDIQLDLTAYLQGGLPSDRRAAIESHLGSCQVCAEEADAMRDIGRLLSRGMKEWVDQGVCPPEVMERIEMSLRAERRRPWWQAWPTYAGAVAAAVILLVMITTRSTDLSHQVASIPLVGTLAAHLLYPGTDVRVDDIPDMQQALAEDEGDGVTLTVYQVTTGPKVTQIQYALRGSNLVTDGPMTQYEASVAGPRGDLKLRNTRIQRATDELLVTAEYEPVLPGTALTVTVADLPLKAGRARSTWQVTVKP